MTSKPRSLATCFKTASPIGERQMFPKHTTSTETFRKDMMAKRRERSVYGTTPNVLPYQAGVVFVGDLQSVSLTFTMVFSRYAGITITLHQDYVGA